MSWRWRPTGRRRPDDLKKQQLFRLSIKQSGKLTRPWMHVTGVPSELRPPLAGGPDRLFGQSGTLKPYHPAILHGCTLTERWNGRAGSVRLAAGRQLTCRHNAGSVRAKGVG